MNTKTPNPYLKQLISEIAGKSSIGRITTIKWPTLKEAGLGQPKPNPDEEEEDPNVNQPEEAPPSAKPDAAAPEADPTADQKPAASSPSPLDGEAPPEDAPAPEPEMPPEGEDAEDAQADAAKAKAELEKARAEKDRAEKEIQQQSYIKLSSNAGTQFLVGKLLNHAFKTNTIDSLAAEMVQKLKIQTPEDMNAFIEDTAPMRVIAGMPELLTAMKTLATKQPDVAAATDEEPPM